MFLVVGRDPSLVTVAREQEEARPVSERPPRTDFGSADGAIARGLATVFKQIFRRDVTEEYPKEIEPPPPRATSAGTC